MPKMKQMNIISLTDLIYAEIWKSDLMTNAKTAYWYSGIIPIRKYFEIKSYSNYTVKRMDECVKYYRGQFLEQGVQRTKSQYVRKVAHFISSYLENTSISWERLPHWSVSLLPEKFCNCFEDYMEHQRQKGYGEYLFTKKQINIDLKESLQVKVLLRKKYHKGFSKDEVLKILSQIDRSTVCGKRDYAILMIAANKGLRGIDVLNLNFSNIDWIKQEICIKQSKTSYIKSDPSKGTQTANAALTWGGELTETGRLQVTKVNGSGAVLEGAEFELTEVPKNKPCKCI